MLEVRRWTLALFHLYISTEHAVVAKAQTKGIISHGCGKSSSYLGMAVPTIMRVLTYLCLLCCHCRTVEML